MSIRITRYELSAKEESEIINLLCGRIGWRELGRRLSNLGTKYCSPQQAVNLTAVTARQWMQDGKLAITDRKLAKRNKSNL